MNELNEALWVETTVLFELCSEVGLEAALRESHEHPVLLFKHSRVCPLSQRALDQLLWHLQGRNVPISYVTTVQRNPNICEAVTRILGVHHETPQAILVDGGRAIWHRAHRQITAEALAAAARIVLFRLNRQGSKIPAPEPDDSAIEETTTRRADGVDGDSRLTGDDGRLHRRVEEPDDDDDDDEAPETPLDEPAPTPVQDPPDEPDKGPYTVHSEAMSVCVADAWEDGSLTELGPRARKLPRRRSASCASATRSMPI